MPVTNDFVVHSIAAASDIRVYNVGAEARWPEHVKWLRVGDECFVSHLNEAVARGLVDYVALRLFDSHRGRRGWRWPPTAEEVEENTRVAEEFVARTGARIVKGRYFWFIDGRSVPHVAASKQCSE